MRRYLPSDCTFSFERLAINQEQVEQYGLPTQPAKDTRDGWSETVELEAMTSETLLALCRGCIERHIDQERLRRLQLVETAERETLEHILTSLWTGRIVMVTTTARPPRPQAVSIIVDGIPDELKQRRQWVLWKYEWRATRQVACGSGRRNPSGRTAATRSLTNRRRGPRSRQRGPWYQLHPDHYDGIGFVFAEDDEFCGIDLDACRCRDDGRLTEWSASIINSVGSYAEVSPSGEGVKLVVRAKLPIPSKATGRVAKPKNVETFGDKKPEVAMFDKRRFWCMTGRRLNGTPATIEARQQEVEAVFAQYFGSKSKPSRKATSTASRNGKVTEETGRVNRGVPSRVLEKAKADNEPFCTKSTRGTTTHPAARIKTKAWQNAVALLREFGCTPAARASVEAIPEIPEADPMMELIRTHYSKTPRYLAGNTPPRDQVDDDHCDDQVEADEVDADEVS